MTDPIEESFCVSPTGSGTACTSVAPCGLATAQSQVEALTSTMSGDLDVELACGTYAAGSSGLNFAAADSGENGFQIVNAAKSGPSPEFSWSNLTNTDSVGSTPLPFQDTFSCPIPAGTWRYVELAKTNTATFTVGEVWVFGR